MVQITKIFRFETAHAIYGYPGPCSNLHGHSYRLHVTVAREDGNDWHLHSPGFVMDFKELKQLINDLIVYRLDHHTLLSNNFLAQYPSAHDLPGLWIWETEPTAENMLIYIRNTLLKELPLGVLLRKLKIFETADSYAEWEDSKMY